MKKRTDAVSNIVNTVERYKAPGDRVCGVMLALVPLLQHYVGLVDNAASTVLLLLVPWLALRILTSLKGLKLSRFRVLGVLMVFFLYKLVAHGTFFSEIAQVCLMVGFLTAISMDCIDLKAFTLAASVVASAAGALLIIQYVCFYLLGFHLQLVPTGLLLAESEQWVLGAQTGLVGITGKVSNLYRPSAFFLEPSHLFLYSFPVLFLNLLGHKRTWRQYLMGLLISAGLVLSTSGMGIAAAGAAWGAFCAFWNEQDDSIRIRNIVRRRNLLMMAGLVAGGLLAVMVVPFLRQSVMRIFVNLEGSTAIGGRTTQALKLLGRMDGIQWVFGVADFTNVSFNVPGFFSMLYRYGIIGLVLSYQFYVCCLAKLDSPWFWTGVVILVVSLFSAHTHGTFFMLYYVLFLTEGHHASTGRWQQEIRQIVRSFVRGRKGEQK